MVYDSIVELRNLIAINEVDIHNVFDDYVSGIWK